MTISYTRAKIARHPFFLDHHSLLGSPRLNPLWGLFGDGTEMIQTSHLRLSVYGDGRYNGSVNSNGCQTRKSVTIKESPCFINYLDGS